MRYVRVYFSDRQVLHADRCLSVGGRRTTPPCARRGAGDWDTPAASSHCNGGKGLAVPDTWKPICQVVHGRESRRTKKKDRCDVEDTRRRGYAPERQDTPYMARYLLERLVEMLPVRGTECSPESPGFLHKGRITLRGRTRPESKKSSKRTGYPPDREGAPKVLKDDGRGTLLWGAPVEGFPPWF